MKSGLTQRDLAEIADTLSAFPEIEEAVLFGSRAKGNYKPGSDIDIAIKGKAIEQSCVNSLSYALNEESSLPYFFDIIHYESISEQALIDHIDRVGSQIYKRPSNAGI